ncbi:hypothetical protein Bca52824_094272 [Brassica carinata]|uniref:Uncharacterized protein n=1 Tax=Brassica carinata TaxID=52824 RepID=A0A8X7P471_BRACI|nr:hypothetical protein Bca52824_094272 [Brassica carinata]
MGRANCQEGMSLPFVVIQADLCPEDLWSLIYRQHSYQNNSIASSSSWMHSSGDEDEAKPAKEEFYIPELPSGTEQQISNSPSHAESYYPSFEDVLPRFLVKQNPQRSIRIIMDRDLDCPQLLGDEKMKHAKLFKIQVLFTNTTEDSGVASNAQALSWHPSNSNDSVQDCHLIEATALERKVDTNDSFINTDGHVTSHGKDDNEGIPDQLEPSYIPKDSLKLVPLNSFTSPSRVNKINFPVSDKPAEKDKGSLCYEPPRFPSADIPFFSCDLVPSNSGVAARVQSLWYPPVDDELCNSIKEQETRRSSVYYNDVEMQLSSPDKSGSRPDNEVNTTASEPPFTVDSSPLSTIARNKTNNAESSFDIIENCSIFDGTPFKQLLDTPSPWKSLYSLVLSCIAQSYLQKSHLSMKREMKAPTISQEGNKKGSHGRPCGPARRSTKGQWTAEEDEVLCKAVERFQGKNWKKIAECFKDRTDVQCLHRWQKVLNPELVKGPWSKEEDDTIIALVEKYGPTKWSTISQHLPGRIGKQCRERWHNHLNPGINKNAWTQEEELTLIRAHQIYGNKWAELTKFLPGRSDNSIKNHWNSSVKKKLDSYYASGLLDQSQSSPLIPIQNNSIASSSSWMQSSGDEGNFRPGADAEESECSQASTVFSCSQSTNDLLDEVKPANEEFYIPELPSGTEQQISNSSSHEDVITVVPEFFCEAESSKEYQNHNGLTEVRTTTATEDHLQGVSNNAKQDLDLDCSQLMTDNMEGDEKNGACQAFQNSVSLSDQPSLPNSDTSMHPQPQTLITDEECCRVLFSNTEDTGISSGEQDQNLVDTRKGKESIPASETENIPALSWHPSNSNNSVQDCHLLEATALEHKVDTNDGFIDTDGHVTSHGNDNNDGISEQQEPSYIPKDSLKLVHLNNFTSPSRVNKIHFPIDDKPAEKDRGSLCYEPPRFPSADIPFFSCDLVPSNSDLRQEYSPFGIRQLMISSMNCTTPLRLWDSPYSKKSPDVMLKDAAKSFSGTPSILKKRHRDLMMSPVLDRRKEKLLKSAEASSLAKDFSRLDVMLNKNECASSSEAKKNPEETLESRGVTSAKIEQETRRSSVYYNDVEMQLSSPDKSGSRPDNEVNTTASEPPFTVDSSPLSTIARNKTNSAESSFDIIENCSIFDGTPFKKLLGTPSQWKSPLLFGSFLHSPKLPPEITFEDIGCFMSPGDRSYDAIGLMKHLSEHTATAYADALEVLGNDTPETILKKRQLNKSVQGKENQHWPHDQLENRSQVECRALDFSDCGTPGKAKVSSASPGGYSSPSSYLLKSCR